MAEVYSVSASRGKNRLHVVFGGKMSAAEFGRALAEIASCVDQLRPGFDMLADVSALEPLPEESLPGIRETAELLVRKGIRHAVRVVGRATEATVQFERMTRVAGYGANLAFSVEEAERMLDGPPLTDEYGF